MYSSHNIARKSPRGGSLDNMLDIVETDYNTHVVSSGTLLVGNCGKGRKCIHWQENELSLVTVS